MSAPPRDNANLQLDLDADGGAAAGGGAAAAASSSSAAAPAAGAGAASQQAKLNYAVDLTNEAYRKNAERLVSELELGPNSKFKFFCPVCYQLYCEPVKAGCDRLGQGRGCYMAELHLSDLKHDF